MKIKTIGSNQTQVHTHTNEHGEIAILYSYTTPCDPVQLHHASRRKGLEYRRGLQNNRLVQQDNNQASKQVVAIHARASD